MNIEETKQEKQVRDISEQKNPYDKVCPGRHLWSEGFRSGFNYAQERTKDCYPKEFVEWIYKKCILKFGVFYVSTETGQETIKSLDELFIYWRDNIK